MEGYLNRFQGKNISEGIIYLQDEITKISQDPHSERLKYFANNLNEILSTIFFTIKKNEKFSQKMDLTTGGWLNQITNKRTGNDILTLSEDFKNSRINFTLLIDFLSPPLKNNKYNLFNFLFLEKYMKDRFYEVDIETFLPFHTYHLVKTKQYNSNLIKKYQEIFDDRRIMNFEKIKLILNGGELFLIMFLLNLKKFHPVKCIVETNERLTADQLKEYYFDEFEKEFDENPSLILLRRYMEFFTKDKFNPIFILVKFLIEEYFINPYIYGVHETESTKVPSPQIFHTIFLLIHYLQKYHELGFHETSNKDIDQIEKETISKNIYHFLLNMLKIWLKDQTNNHTRLCDLGKVWLKYLKPWESVDPYNFINSLNSVDNGETIYRDNTYLLRKENLNLDENESKLYNMKDNYFAINAFFKSNPLFYTHIFVQYFLVFSDLQNIDFKEILFLKNFLIFFRGTQPESIIFHGHLSKRWFEGLSNDRCEGKFDLRKYIDSMSSEIVALNLFDNEYFTARIYKICSCLTKFKEKFKKKQSNPKLFRFLLFFFFKDENFNFIIDRIEVFNNFIEKSLINLFSLDERQIKYNNDENCDFGKVEKPLHIQNKILRKSYPTWETSLEEGEYQFLYNVFYYIAMGVDLIRDNHEKTSNYPITNLRWFASLKNTSMTIILFVFLFIVLFLFFSFLFNTINNIIDH